MTKNQILSELQAGVQSVEDEEWDLSDFFHFVYELLKENGWET